MISHTISRYLRISKSACESILSSHASGKMGWSRCNILNWTIFTHPTCANINTCAIPVCSLAKDTHKWVFHLSTHLMCTGKLGHIRMLHWVCIPESKWKLLIFCRSSRTGVVSRAGAASEPDPQVVARNSGVARLVGARQSPASVPCTYT